MKTPGEYYEARFAMVPIQKAILQLKEAKTPEERMDLFHVLDDYDVHWSNEYYHTRTFLSFVNLSAQLEHLESLPVDDFF